MMTALERVTRALEDRGSQRRGRDWSCPGPLHASGDRKPSLGVTQGSKGVVLCCGAGCLTEDVVAALGLSMADLFDEPPREVARYPYRAADGTVVFAKTRFEPKTFSLSHPDGDRWKPGLNGSERPLYRLPEVLRAIRDRRVIWVTEGEKDADRLWELGEAATCNFDGASRWRPEYGDYLKGADVRIVTDRDEPGVAHALAAYKDLKGKVSSVQIVEPRTTGKGHDISDHLDAGYSLAEVIPFRPETEISRRYTKVNWHEAFRSLSEETDWLLPPVLEAGTINALFGRPGVGKSLLTLEFALTLVREGRTVLILDEENRTQDTVERLRDFGATPGELDRLALYNFASLPPLDTPDGGEHLAALAEKEDPALVILDTTTRMVEGDENAATTWLQLYRNSLVPLKQRGITVLRLDHPGKDDTRGQRGSSAKAGDVDTIWCLSDISNSDQLTLIRQKSRSGHGEPVITYQRKTKPLRHELIALGDLAVLPQVRAASDWFDRHGVPRETGRPRLRDVLSSTHGAPEVSTTMLALVARYRKGLEAG